MKNAKFLLALALCLLLIVSAASAEMTTANNQMTFYVGENNLLYLAGYTQAVSADALTNIVLATDSKIYYETLDGDPYVADGVSEPVFALKTIDYTTGAVNTVATGLRGDAVAIPGDAIYFVLCADANKLYRYADGDVAATLAYTAAAPITALQRNISGLALTTGGLDCQYIGFAKTIMALSAADQGNRYFVSPDGATELILTGDGVLAFYATEDSAFEIASNVRAAFLGQGIAYYMSGERFYSYILATGETKTEAALTDAVVSNPRFVVIDQTIALYDSAAGVPLYVTKLATTGTALSGDSGDAPVVIPTPTAVPYTDLKSGDKGDAVTALQQKLSDLGYLLDKVDGKFGANTESAVKAAQKDLGLKEDGVATAEFQNQLFSGALKKLDLLTPLSKGDSGTLVTRLQDRLRELGYMAASADGKFGDRTKEAVELFQEENSLRITGEADETFLRQLYAAKAKECSSYIPLQYGDSGPRVKELITRLKKLYYYSGSVTQTITRDIQNAYYLFQEQIGFQKNSTASVKMQSKLFAKSAPENPGYVTFQKGDKNNRIEKYQGHLIYDGYLRGDIMNPGNFSYLTEQACKELQYDMGFEVTGKMTDDVQVTLEQLDIFGDRLSMKAGLNYVVEYVNYVLNPKTPYDRYDAVEYLQKRLVELKYLAKDFTPTGVYGTMTANAVALLQKQYNLIDFETESYLVGDCTYEVMDILLNSKTKKYTGKPADYDNKDNYFQAGSSIFLGEYTVDITYDYEGYPYEVFSSDF